MCASYCVSSLLLCGQVIVVYLCKQDAESFFLGTYIQNGVTQAKAVALEYGIILSMAHSLPADT